MKLKASLAFGAAIFCGAGIASADVVKDSTGANVVAVPGGITDNTQQTVLVGSDTLEKLTRQVIASLRSAGRVTQIKDTDYKGQGSSQGQRQLEGSPNAGTDEPTCTPADGNGLPEGNPGCQEIAPMSRRLNNGICDDDGPYDTTTHANLSNTHAESMSVCGGDAVVILANNADNAQYVSSGSCPASGTSSDNTPTASDPPGATYHVSDAYANAGQVRNSGSLSTTAGTYTLGTASLSPWKDTLRLLYTGCRHDQTVDGTANGAADPTCATAPRVMRCSDPARVELLNAWENIVETGTACSTAGRCGTGADNGLRAAYRRDDGSGTTTVFMQFLGLSQTVTSRTRLVSTGVPTIVQIPATHIYCDGGDIEGQYPDNGNTFRGDPITKPCRAEDDVCGPNGRQGVVRAIRSPHDSVILQPDGVTTVTVTPFPAVQCTRGLFDYKNWINTALAVCPDGTKPAGGTCQLPYYRRSDGTRDYNCLNDLGSHPSSASTVDGRVYNTVVRDSNGNVGWLGAATRILPDVANWRTNQAVLDVSNPVPGGPIGNGSGGACPSGSTTCSIGSSVVCAEQDATRTIACLVSNTQCAVGFAGRESASTPGYTALQEPLIVGGLAPSDANIIAANAPPVTFPPTTGYLMSREIYYGASGGFQNILADCIARGGSNAYCNDEVTIVTAIKNNEQLVKDACAASGFPQNPGDTVPSDCYEAATALCSAAAETNNCSVTQL